MSKLTAIRIRYQDGTISSEIPVGVFAENVNWTDEITLTDILGYQITLEEDGTIRSIQKQIDEKIDQNEFFELIANHTDKNLTQENTIADAKAVGDKFAEIQENINNIEIDPIDLQNKLKNIETIPEHTSFDSYLRTLSASITREIINQEVSEEYIQQFVKEGISIDELLGGEIILDNPADPEKKPTKIYSSNEKLIIDHSKLKVFKDVQNSPIVEFNYSSNINDVDQQSFIFRDNDGDKLFTSQGIKAKAVPNQFITNDMIQDETITIGKLSFIPIKANLYGGIYISQIYYNDGKTFQDDYSEFKQDTEDVIDRLNDKIDAAIEDIQDRFNGRIDNSATYTLYIDCPNGTNIHGQNIILTAHLFRNSVEVTDEFDDQYFTWTRQSSDYYGDIYWNDNHQFKTKTITVTANDVKINADFRCVFEYEGTTVTSG